MWKIMGSYAGQAAKEIDTADTREEAETYLSEYRMAFGPSFTLWIVKG